MRKPELKVSGSLCLLWFCLLAPVVPVVSSKGKKATFFPPLKECFRPQCQWRWNLDLKCEAL